MSLFRPVNSSESNLYTIRVSLGYGSNKGEFDTTTNPIVNDDILCSNNNNNTVTVDHLASPTYNNLPKDFYIKYLEDSSYVSSFFVNYGKQFVAHPSINITAHSSEYVGNPVIIKNIHETSLPRRLLLHHCSIRPIRRHLHRQSLGSSKH